MKSETIVYVGGFELPDRDAAAHRVVGNANILKELGYKVIFIDVNRSPRVNKNSNNIIMTDFDIQSLPFPQSIFDWFKYLTDISHIKEIIKTNRNVKALICYNYPAILLYKIIRYCKSRDIRVISDVTEWYEDNRVIKKIDTCIRMRYLNKKVNGIIAISSFLGDYYMPYTNTIIVPPLIDKKDDKWKKIDTESDKNIIKLVYSGNPGKHKDKLNIIIESMRVVIDFSVIFTVIGLTKEQYLVYYPEHVKLLELLEEKIIFLGRVSHIQSINLVKESDFQIFIRENKRVNNAGFPTKFVESLACGTPVITTRTSDLTNYLVENKNGFFVDYDKSSSLISILKDICNMTRSEIDEMKECCTKNDTFDYRKHMNEVDKFMKKTIIKGER